MAAAEPAPGSLTCLVCGAKATARCTGCKQAHYCSIQCQKSHWPAHKSACGKAAPPAPSAASTPSARQAESGSSGLEGGSSNTPLVPVPPTQPKQPSGLRPGWLRNARSLLVSSRPAQANAAPAPALLTQATAQDANTSQASSTAANAAGHQQPAMQTPAPMLQPRPPSAPKPPQVPHPAPSQSGHTAAPAPRRPMPFLKRGFLSQPAAKPNPEAATGVQPVATPLTIATRPGLIDAQITPARESGIGSKSSAAQRLPGDVLTIILGLLPARSLASAMQVCKEWRYVGSQPALWRSLIAQLGVLLPHTWVQRPPQATSQMSVPGDGRLSPAHPRPPSSHLVAGVQSIRALRAALPAPQGSGRPGSGRHAPAGPPLHIALGAALQQRANWQQGRYAEHPLHEHSANVECLAFVKTQLWGSALVSSSWDGAVIVHQLWPAAAQLARPSVASPCQYQHFDMSAQPAATDAWSWAPHVPCNPTRVRRYNGHTGWVTSMAAGCEYVVTASTDRRVAMWCYRDPGPQPTGVVTHPREVTIVRFAYSGCETLVLTGCTDGSLRLLDLTSRQQLRLLEGHVDAVWGMVHLPHNQLLTSSRDGCLRIWQLPQLFRSSTSVTPRPLAPSRELAGTVTHAATGPAQPSSSQPPAARATRQWEAVACTLPALITASAISRCPLGSDVLSSGPYALHSTPALPEQFVYSLCDEPSTQTGGGGGGGSHQGQPGDLIAAPARPAPHTVVLNSPPGPSDTASAPLRVLQAHSKPVLCMDIVYLMHAGCGTAPHQPVVSVPNDFYQWNPVGIHSALLGKQTDRPSVLVATGGADAVVHIWDVSDVSETASGPVRTLDGHQHGVLSVKFGWLPEMPCASGSHGGNCMSGSDNTTRRLVLIAGAVKQVKVWDPLAGVCLMVMNDHSGPVTSIAISHDHVITLAMNNGLVVYSCSGVPARDQPAANRKILVPVLELPDGAQRSFAAALAVCPQALAVGQATGTTTLLDWTSKSVLWLGPKATSVQA